MKYHLFISYPSEEYEVALQIYNHFKGRYQVFMDRKTLIGGMDWTMEIPKAQKESLVTIAIISHGTKRAFYEREEITRAINLRKKQKHVIIPILLEGESHKSELPFGLQNIQYIRILQRNNLTSIYKEVIVVLQQMKVDLGFESEIGDTVELINNPIAAETIDYVLEKEEEILNFFLNRIRKFSYRVSFFFSFLDIDKFTQINFKYGKKCANKILQTIESIISELGNDVSFHRLFQDEICIVIPKCNLENGIHEMEELQRKILMYDWQELANGLFVSTRIGVSLMENQREYVMSDVKEGIIKAAIGCENIQTVLGEIVERQEPIVFEYPVKFPRIKKGPKFLTLSQTQQPLIRYSSGVDY